MLLSLSLFILTWLGWFSPSYAQDVAPAVLHVTAPVRGANVVVEFEDAGEVPVTRYLTPGTYLIRVTADGYDPFVRKVDLRANTTTTVNAELVAGGGTVEFVVKPAGADVEINGALVGKAPIRVASMPPGEHKYKVSMPGYETQEGRFTQPKGGNPLLRLTLESSKGRFEVVSRPSGAQVWLDGEPVGETPLSLRDVPPGLHQVLIAGSGTAWLLREVDTSDGSKGEIEAGLSTAGTEVQINTLRSDAEVLLAGVPVATGRSATLLLSRGDWPLTIRSGSESLEATISVPLQGQLLYKVRWPEDGQVAELLPMEPVYKRWTFWAAVGVGSGALSGSTALVVRALQPDPPPTGDVVVTLP